MTDEEAIDLIKDAGFGLLATTEGKQPRVRPMMPFLTDEGELLVALLGRSRTIPQIKENPQVEVCFVDRKMWYCRVTGKAKISDDKAKKQVLWDAIPMLKQYFGGVQDQNFVLLEIDVQSAEAMTPHQKQPEKVSLKA
jgi:general stress protein 26